MTVSVITTSSIMSRGLIAIIALLLAGLGPVRSQEGANLRGDSSQTRKRLAEAEQKLLAGKHADAIDDLQRILDEAGDDLITVDTKHYRTARSVAQGLLARLPGSALKSYQDRIDDPARRLLAAARKSNDPAPLWQLIDRYFVSRSTPEAIQLLGDLVFERGEFRTAERLWRRLLLDAGGDIRYPGSPTDPAAVHARIVLALIFQADLERARAEFNTFKARYGGTSGTLAGKSGPLADTLQGFLDRPPRLPSPANPGSDWPTFGGGPSRSGRVAARLSGEWPRRPTWEHPLGPSQPAAGPLGPPFRPPFGHPIVVNGKVYVTDGWKLHAFDLVTGRSAGTLTMGEPPRARRLPATPVEPCPTLSASGNHIFLRVGPGVISPTESGKEGTSTIACVRVSGERNGGTSLKEMWRIAPPPAEDKAPVTWEGAPLVVGRRMWAAYARFEGGRVVHGIACYDPCDSTSAPDRPAWTADVCDGAVHGATGRGRHELLTLAGRNVVFCSNTGAVVALDATTGHRAWAFRYQRARQVESTHPADATPPLLCGGRLFVAPADGDGVYALDPETGELLWQSAPASGTEPTRGLQLLGVSAGHLITTRDGPVKGIRALPVATGSFRTPADSGSNGWIQHDGGGLLTYGRGFVADDIIVWPTEAGLYFLRAEDGRPLHGEPLQNPLGGLQSGYFGNVICADGVIVVVTPTHIWGYVSEARQFGPHSRSARDPAIREFEKVAEWTETALANGDISGARARLLSLAKSQLPRQYRAWAAARLLLLTPPTTDEAKLPADIRGVLTPELREEWLFAPDGLPVTLGQLVDRQVGRETLSAPQSPFHSPNCRRPPASESTLAASVDIRRTLRLDPGSAPLRWIPGAPEPGRCLYTTTNSELVTISLTEGEQARYDRPAPFTHVADLPQGFVTAGPLTVAVYGSDRRPLWVFRVPSTPPLPHRAGAPYLLFDTDSPIPELSGFSLSGFWLFAHLGDRHLVAFDLLARRVAWVLAADGRAGYEPFAFPGAPRFGPMIGLAGPSLIAQLTSGQRWFIQAQTGKPIRSHRGGEQTAHVQWPQAPPEVEAGFAALADGPGLIRLVEVPGGHAKWTFEANGEASLAGDPPQVMVQRDAVLVAVRRNYGVELDRLDREDGKSLWGGVTAFIDDDRIELDKADADSERVVVPSGNRLFAFSLRDGSSCWKARLPHTLGAGRWTVRVGRECVIAYPDSAVPREPVPSVLGRFWRSFRREPGLARLPFMVLGAYDAWVTRSVPVLLFDLETGKRLVRFDIPATGPAMAACFDRERAVVATGDRVVWLR